MPPAPDDAADRWSELGEFIRQQRSTARLSLRRLSENAGISNPYLSQIERGLRKPSAEILQQIAKALRISAETLYVRAGILEDDRRDDDVVRHILTDPHLIEEQRQALVRIYWSFRHENGLDDRDPDGPPAGSHDGETDGETDDATSPGAEGGASDGTADGGAVKPAKAAARRARPARPAGARPAASPRRPSGEQPTTDR